MRVSFALAGPMVVISACTTTGQTSSADAVYDPFESWNRGVYVFNDEVDKAVLGPVADGYRAVTNPPIRQGVSNFLTNLNQPVVFVNTVLQGKPVASFDTATRFVLNTTVGIGGIFDPASYFEVPRHNEDFGQTLGVYGVPNGAYLVLPFLGPSNVRDAVGFGVDIAFDPLNYATFDGDDETRIGLFALGTVSGRERIDEQVEILRDQPEPYIALRRTYTQTRAGAIRDGRAQEDPFEDLPEFDDYDFGDEIIE
ncbi:MAG: VacJ family lipoprotein [Pseudomonadota bacterium]